VYVHSDMYFQRRWKAEDASTLSDCASPSKYCGASAVAEGVEVRHEGSISTLPAYDAA
jgi:hypothetical protein